MARKFVRCPNCNTENAFDDEGGRILDCISCCYDETIPPTFEEVPPGPSPEPTFAKITDTQIIKRGCTFGVDDKGKVVRVVSNG